MLDLKLVKMESEEKIQTNVRIYRTTWDKVTAICDAENIRPTDLVRSLINEFLADYAAHVAANPKPIQK